ncbi:hypothetical protein IMY05_C4467000400 [Salix suchowensis]|nr:hypothetical protein IMY05_C4467000400 [Salix suchowensis]
MEDTAIPHAGIDLKCVKSITSQSFVLIEDCQPLHCRLVAAGLLFGVGGEFTIAKAKVGVEVKTGFKWGIEKAVIAIPGTHAATPYAKDGCRSSRINIYPRRSPIVALCFLDFDFSLSKDEDDNKATGEIGVSVTPKFSLGITGKDKLSKIKFTGSIGLKAGLGLTVGITGTPPKRDLDAMDTSDAWYCAKIAAYIEGVAGVDAKHPVKFIPDWEKEYSMFKKELEIWSVSTLCSESNCSQLIERCDSTATAPAEGEEEQLARVAGVKSGGRDGEGYCQRLEMPEEGYQQDD